MSVTSDMSVVSPEYSGFIHKTDRRDITEILLKLALNTITPHPPIHVMMAFFPSTAFIVLISFYSVPLYFRRKYGMQYLSKWRCYFTWKYTIQLSLYCSLLFLCEKRRYNIIIVLYNIGYKTFVSVSYASSTSQLSEKKNEKKNRASESF